MPQLSEAPLVYELVETTLGNTFLVRSNGLSDSTGLIVGDTVKERHVLDITDDEFNDLMDQSMTCTFSYDDVAGKVVVTPKESS